VSLPECFAWGVAYGVTVALAALLTLFRLAPPL
jgi:hypothetical protein